MAPAIWRPSPLIFAFLVGLVFIVLPALTWNVHAQQISAEDAAQEALRRQEERTKLQQAQAKKSTDVLRAESDHDEDTRLPIESPCFHLTSIQVGDFTEWRWHFLQSMAKPFVGQCVGVQGLRKIAGYLDARLIDAGYVTTRVSLAKQNLSEGNLIFSLHVGRLAGVVMKRARSGDADTDWGTWKNAFPLAIGKPLNIRDLEQGVEQMKRLPSQSITTKIEPGIDADTSIVNVEREPADLNSRTHGTVSLDNSGSQTLGRAQLSANLSFDNLFGLNDIVSINSNINAQQPNPRHRSYGVTTSYSIPWDYHLFSLSTNTNRFAQYVQGTTARFLSSGKSNASDAQWSYTALRSASSKWGVYGSVSARSAESFLDDVELVVQRRRTTNLEWGFNYKKFIENGSVDFSMGYRRGIGWGKAQDDYLSAATDGLTIRPRILNWNGSVYRAFQFGEKTLSWNSQMRGQSTRDMTLSIDHFSIGGRASVRGFDGDSVLLAESGLLIRNEVSAPFAIAEGWASNLYLALDYGRVTGASSVQLPGNALMGCAIGVRGQWNKMYFDLSVATPVKKPEQFRSARFTPYLSLTYSM